MHYITFPCIALHCIVVQCTAAQCVVFHSIPFRSIPSHSIPFHYITYIHDCDFRSVFLLCQVLRLFHVITWGRVTTICGCRSTLAQGHIWGTRGKIARTQFWWLLKGVDPISFGKVWTPWTFGWTIGWETISGEIYFDLLEAASGTAVAVTLVAEPGGSCYQARKAWLLARVMRNPLACGVSYRVLTRAQMTFGNSCRRPVSYMECFQRKRRRT